MSYYENIMEKFLSPFFITAFTFNNSWENLSIWIIPVCIDTITVPTGLSLGLIGKWPFYLAFFLPQLLSCRLFSLSSILIMKVVCLLFWDIGSNCVVILWTILKAWQRASSRDLVSALGLFSVQRALLHLFWTLKREVSPVVELPAMAANFVL